MTAPVPITLVAAAILVAMSVPMAIAVGLRRAKTGILMLHGEDDDLLRRIRAHANFTEYVPLALIGLAGAELAGAPGWLVATLAATLIAARGVHYVGLRRAPAGTARAVGAALTTTVMLVSAVTILVYVLA